MVQQNHRQYNMVYSWSTSRFSMRVLLSQCFRSEGKFSEVVPWCLRSWTYLQDTAWMNLYISWRLRVCMRNQDIPQSSWLSAMKRKLRSSSSIVHVHVHKLNISEPLIRHGLVRPFLRNITISEDSLAYQATHSTNDRVKMIRNSFYFLKRNL